MTDVLASLLGVKYGDRFRYGKVCRLVRNGYVAGQRVLDARLDRGGGIAFASLVGICAEPASTAYGGGYRLEVGAGDLERAAALGAFKHFMPFLTMLFVAEYSDRGIAGYQGEDFLVNIIDMSVTRLGCSTQIDSVVTLTILAIFGLMVLVKIILKALSVLYGLIITGMMVMAFVSFGQERMGLSPVTWLFLQSLCLYMAYLTFRRFSSIASIACFQDTGKRRFLYCLNRFSGVHGYDTGIGAKRNSWVRDWTGRYFITNLPDM